MKRIILAITALLFFSPNHAQQALWSSQDLVSPMINPDNTVTFKVLAPEADMIQLTADFLPKEMIQTEHGTFEVPGKAPMIKDEAGVWSYTTVALNSDLYGYNIVVDGVTTTDPGNPFQIRDVASTFNIFIVSGEMADLYKVQKVPHGSVTRRWYDSPGLNMNRRMTVYTPPGYEASSEKYPVLYLLHGAGGDEEAWISLGRLSQIMDNLIAQGKAKPMIVVMPNGNIIQEAAPGESSKGYYKPQFMIPGTMNGVYEENFTDIVHFVESTYRVKADKSDRAIAGLSMGGFHTIHISRYYPDMFDYIGAFSAAIMPKGDATGKVYNDIDGTLRIQKEKGYKLYWIGIGKADFLYKNNVDFRARLDSIGLKYEYTETEGGHTWSNWRTYMTQFVPLLFN